MLLRHAVVGPSSGLRAASLLLKAPAPAATVLTPFAQRPLARWAPSRSSPVTRSSSLCYFWTSAPPPADSPPQDGAAAGQDEPDISDCPLLEPPWQLRDLNAEEREAWYKHGRDMLDFLPRAHVSRRSIVKRRRAAQGFEERLGPNWYAILTEAKRIDINPEMPPLHAERVEKLDKLVQEYEEAKEAGKPMGELAALMKKVRQQKYENVVSFKAERNALFAKVLQQAKRNLYGDAEE